MATIKSWMTEEQPAETAPQQQPAQSTAQPQSTGVQPAAAPEPGNAQLAEQLLLAQAENHNRQQQQAYNDWKSTFDQVLSNPLYQGKGTGNKAGDVKRKEAAIKSLVGAFGGLADTINVAFGGTVPVRDVRPDVYATQKEADLLDRQEQQIEQDGRKRQQALVEKLLSLRPKYETNDAIFKLAGTLADREKYQTTAQQSMERLKQQQVFTAEQKEKDRKNRKEIADARKPGSDSTKQSDYVALPDETSQDGRLILPKNLWNPTTFGNLINVIINDPAVKDDPQAILTNMKTILGESNPAVNMQSFIGQFIHRSPKLRETLRRYDIRYNPQTAAGAETEPEEEFNVEL